ncbi:23S rRNA (adenine(2503)-C(2))-methyltransferase RlmN [Verrucomicrobiaceae bacterium N1E253]|uniref:Probable dual-specificity RNA methyltransferase RlmN n=1 Tax=Oceaniferula marina TaxID=2748318 RepID=A0A851GKG1_9BACT|nr:23S rRNA (adenine(2503)-C(2))-methyltransferase RlmN [Oceaniferula marina]NWK54654.1 23S rRNA (adenine(2503)-C(2))-methyltransferase RlmN [Oceaniferula marina]
MTNPPHPTDSLLGLSKEDLESYFTSEGEKPYRAKQVLEWLYQQRVNEIDEMSNLSAPMREKLEARFHINNLKHVETKGSEDTTRKFLFKLDDGRYVETVFIPASKGLKGKQSSRKTICVSSQVGCAYGCKFCASGLAGFTRNLTAAEIVGQMLSVEQITGEKINNIVFMGMGEPLANLKNLIKALEIITSHWGLNIGARSITVSTSGLAPAIRKLAEFPVPIRLAISLHGATDEVRDRIMPVNSKWQIKELFDSLHYWRQFKKQKISLEYILIKDVNDDLEQAHILAKRAKGINAKVNLIPYNTVEGLEWVRPTEEHCYAFRDVVASYGINTTLRLEKGSDINAACGQLRLKKETAEGIVKAPVKAGR